MNSLVLLCRSAAFAFAFIAMLSVEASDRSAAAPPLDPVVQNIEGWQER